MKLNQRYNMNARPLISHRLLVSTVAEHRNVPTLSVVKNKPVNIDSNPNRNAPFSGAQASVSVARAETARRHLTPGTIGAAWPFFE